MAIDYFEQTIALDDITGSVVPDAVADVYAMEDTEFLTPLEITDLTGIPLTQLRASPTGIYPAFRVASGQTQVLAKVGDMVTPLTSMLGNVLEVVPDPTDAPDNQVLITQGGQYGLAPTGSGGSSIRVFGNAEVYDSPIPAGTSTPLVLEEVTADGIDVEDGAFHVTEPGVYIVNAIANFSLNPNGERELSIGLASEFGAGIVAQETRPALSTRGVTISITRLLQLEAGNVMSLAASQTSGGELSVSSASLALVRVSE